MVIHVKKGLSMTDIRKCKLNALKITINSFVSNQENVIYVIDIFLQMEVSRRLMDWRTRMVREILFYFKRER